MSVRFNFWEYHEHTKSVFFQDLAIPNSQAMKEEISSRTISFYPYIPFIFAFTAFFFQIPTILWKTWQVRL